MQKYAKTKDSGIEWVGPIPAHWSVKPLFALFRERQMPNYGNKEKNVLSLSYGKIIRRDVESNFGLLPESFETYNIIEPGNIVLRLTDLQNDKRSLRCGFVNERGIITSAYLTLEKLKGAEILPDYAYYLLHGYDMRKVFYSMGGGVRQSIKFDDLKRLPVILPPIDEQKTIVGVLESKLCAIDSIIESKKGALNFLEEERDCLISSAVTSGINPKVEMRATSIPWLTKIPSHWVECPVKYHYDIQLGKMLQNAPASVADKPTPYLKALHVLWGRVIVEDPPEMWASPDDIAQYGIRSGDLLVCEGGEVGRAAIVQDPPGNCIIQNALHRVRPKSQKVISRYFLYLLRAVNSAGWFQILCNKATIAHFTRDKFSALKVPIPPIDEQEKIVSFIDSRLSKIDLRIDCEKKAIRLLNEYRSAVVAQTTAGTAIGGNNAT